MHRSILKTSKRIKPYFSNKGLNSSKLLLKDKGNLISDNKELANIMKNFLDNITNDLELKKDSKNKLNNLENILRTFESHPNIEKIKKAISTTEKFCFRHVTEDKVCKLIMNLVRFKVAPARNIPNDMLKETIYIHLLIINQLINMSIDNDCYPFDLKLAEVIPVFKKKDDVIKKMIDLSVFYLVCQRSSKKLPSKYSS